MILVPRSFRFFPPMRSTRHLRTVFTSMDCFWMELGGTDTGGFHDIHLHFSGKLVVTFLSLLHDSHHILRIFSHFVFGGIFFFSKTLI